MEINFGTEEMIAALEHIGYVVKSEEMEVETDRLAMTTETRKVYNVYLHNELMIPWGKPGTYRLKWVFERELEKKLIRLFYTLP